MSNSASDKAPKPASILIAIAATIMLGAAGLAIYEREEWWVIFFGAGVLIALFGSLGIYTFVYRQNTNSLWRRLLGMSMPLVGCVLSVFGAYLVYGDHRSNVDFARENSALPQSSGVLSYMVIATLGLSFLYFCIWAWRVLRGQEHGSFVEQEPTTNSDNHHNK